MYAIYKKINSNKGKCSFGRNFNQKVTNKTKNNDIKQKTNKTDLESAKIQ